MNIFVLYPDPVVAAAWHCDQHVSKMILEGVQLLSTTAHEMFGPITCAELYKPTHTNHPCRIWTGEAYDNCQWLWNLMTSLDAERKFRRPGCETHASIAVGWKAMHILFSLREFFPNAYGTPFVQAMPAEHRGPDVYDAYQRYYRKCKMNLGRGGSASTWTRRGAPKWVARGSKLASDDPQLLLL